MILLCWHLPHQARWALWAECGFAEGLQEQGLSDLGTFNRIRAHWSSRNGECSSICWPVKGCGGPWVPQLPLAVLFKALEKKGISHLDEKDLKERNKRIQEDNRLELQKVG